MLETIVVVVVFVVDDYASPHCDLDLDGSKHPFRKTDDDTSLY